MHTWQWQRWHDRPYLTCSLLQDWSHGFFSRHFWPQTPQDLTAALAAEAKSFRTQQVHGDVVLSANDVAQHAPTETNAYPRADGVISEANCQAVWVCSADCNPILIADKGSRRVAAVHAGWRGTALKILPAAIAKLQAQGSRLEDLRVAMGPAITGAVYQVSTQVAAEVGKTIVHGLFDRDADLLDHLKIQSQPAVLSDPTPGRVRLDVRRVNALQLEHLGFKPDQVAIAPHCTYQEPERFFSYRRTKEKKVQWSGIVSCE